MGMLYRKDAKEIQSQELLESPELLESCQLSKSSGTRRDESRLYQRWPGYRSMFTLRM